MKAKERVLISALVVCLFLFAGSLVMAQGLSGYQRPLITLMLEKRAELKLSQDQTRALESLRLTFQKEATQKAKEMERLEAELDRVLNQENLDMRQVETTIKKGAELMAEMHLGRIQTIEQGKALLNPDQRKAFLDLLKKETAQAMPPGMMEGMMGGTMEGMTGSQTPPVKEKANSRTKKNEAGGVTVEATFQDLRSQGQLAFQIKLDTHSVELEQYDLAKLAQVRNDQGRIVAPRSWKAKEASGHHISGTLIFADKDPSDRPLLNDKTRYIELVVRDIGQVKERTLRWEF